MRSSIGWRTAGLAAAAGLQAASFLVLARELGAAGFGVFGTLFSLGSLMSVVVGFGLAARALRARAEPDAAALTSTMMAVRLLTTAGLVGAMAATVAATGIASGAAVAALAFTAHETVSELTQAVLAGRGAIRLATGLLVAQRAAVLLSIVGGGALHVRDGAVAGVVAVSIAVASALTITTRPRTGAIARLIATSRAYWASGLASAISRLEVPAITLVGGSTVAGMYAASERAVGPVTLLGQAVLQVSTPKLAAADPRTRRAMFVRTRRLTSRVMLAAVVVAVPAGLAGAALLGSGFAPAWAGIAGFVAGAGVMSANQAHQALLLSVGEARTAARCVATGAVCGVVAAAGLTAVGGLPMLGLTPVLAQGVMHVLLRRAVGPIIAAD